MKKKRWPLLKADGSVYTEEKFEKDGIVMVALANILATFINIYIWIIIAHVLIHWLIAFDVINPSSPQAQNLMRLLHKVTDPVMKRVQKFVPPIGGIDLSPLVVIILGQVLIALIYKILVY